MESINMTIMLLMSWYTDLGIAYNQFLSTSILLSSVEVDKIWTCYRKGRKCLCKRKDSIYRMTRSSDCFCILSSYNEFLGIKNNGARNLFIFNKVELIYRYAKFCCTWRTFCKPQYNWAGGKAEAILQSLILKKLQVIWPNLSSSLL